MPFLLVTQHLFVTRDSVDSKKLSGNKEINRKWKENDVMRLFIPGKEKSDTWSKKNPLAYYQCYHFSLDRSQKYEDLKGYF